MEISENQKIPFLLPKAPWWRLRQRVALATGRRRMADDGLLEVVRGLHLAHPELGPKRKSVDLHTYTYANK